MIIHLACSQGQREVTLKGKIFLTFRIGKIIKEDNRALHSAACDGLRTETENGKINNLTEIDLILIKITMSPIFTLSLIAVVGFLSQI